MTRLTFSLMISTFILVQVAGQPLPCDEATVAAGNCDAACIVCNLDGYSGKHDGGEAGIVPEGFCTFIQHNIKWWGFIAGSHQLAFDFHVGDCLLGSGLEIGLFKEDGCESFTLISECRGGNNPIRPGNSMRLKTTEPLVVGQHYFIVMDGNFGDVCDWSFDVVEGKATVEPLRSSGRLEGNKYTCPGIVNTYTTTPVTGAVNYTWSLNGERLHGDKPEIQLPFLEAGLYQLCVVASNACDKAPPSCLLIRVNELEPTIIEASFCEGGCYTYRGLDYCSPGRHEVELINEAGCDSIVILELQEYKHSESHLNFHICEGDSFRVGDQYLSESGQWEVEVDASNGCDSTVYVDLLVVICNIEGRVDYSPPSCYRGRDGILRFEVTNGTPPFTYRVETVEGVEVGRGNISGLNQEMEATILRAGQYFITVDDNFGNQEILIGDIRAPEALGVDFTTSDYLGYPISCYRGSDGILEVIPRGGTPPYTYQWTNQRTSPLIDGLTAGIYSVTVTDSKGCGVVTSTRLDEPTALVIEGEYHPVSCESPQAGTIDLLHGHGGTGLVSFSLDGQHFDQTALFQNLVPGKYQLIGRDENGCTASHEGIIGSPEIPDIKITRLMDIQLGDSILLNPAINNITVKDISWSPPEMVRCNDCLSTYALPMYSSELTLTVTSADDCKTHTNVFLDVIKDRHFYAPTIFSPNGDGINDLFLIHGSIEVAAIQNIRVFDRWGNLIYEESGLKKEERFMQGWDGTFNGQNAPTNAYVWTADIVFIDGESKSVKGTVTLLR